MPSFAFIRVSALVAGLLAATANSAAAQSATSDCNAKDKEAMSKWFPHSSTMEPGNTLTSNSLCAFHVWSTQMFLWLTQTDPVTGQMNLLNLHTIDELFATEGTAKVARADAPLQLRPRTSKGNETDLGAIHQAGSDGVLVDHNGRVIYYEQLFNDNFVNFVRGKFYTGGSFDPEKLAAATGVSDFFPSGVLEIKTSWMVVDGETSADEFLIVPAEIYLLAEQDGKIVVSDQTQSVTVALVGLHIAGTVDDHPEMIWATFEHLDNAPDLPAGVAHDSSDPVSANSFTFYTGGTAANKSNVNAADVLKLDGQTLSPITQVFRQFTYGTPNAAIDGPVNVASIVEVNQALHAVFPPGDTDATQHYLEIGAVWMLPNTLQPDITPMTELRGSTMLSNSTMETFTQNDQQCFSCHNSLPQFEKVSGNLVQLPGTNFNISHALVQEYFRALAAQEGMTIKALR